MFQYFPAASDGNDDDDDQSKDNEMRNLIV